MTNRQFLKIVLLVLFPYFLWSQTTKRNQVDLSYEDLKQAFTENRGNDKKQLDYVNAYIKRAQLNKSSIDLSRGYYLLARIFKGDKAIQYLDYSIHYAKNTNDTEYPANSYILKSYELQNQFRFSEALENLIMAEKFTKLNNIDLYFYIKHAVGILRSEKLGQVEEALVLYRDCLNYYKKKGTKSTKYANSYHYTLFAIADAHKSLNNLDSTSFYNKLGYYESKLTKDEFTNAYFILNEGANQVLKKNYKSALDSIYKALPIMIRNKDDGNILASYYYLGKAYAGIGNQKKAIQNFTKVDSLVQKENNMTFEFIEGYLYLINFYKIKGDKSNQLKFITRYMSIDSILQKRYKVLSKKLHIEYDTPHIISEKENLIQSLQEKQSTSYVWIVILTVSVAGLAGYQFYLKKQHRKRFEAIVRPISPSIEKSTVPETTVKISGAKESQEKQSIATEIVQELLTKLTTFENKKGFLEKTMSIQKLAINLTTNTKYLSKVINEQKGKTFVQYINDLRVEEAVAQLQAQSILRNYTMPSLANEFGFNSAEAFSNAFNYKYKIKPTFFIKSLEKEKKT